MKCEDAMERIHDRLTGDLDPSMLDALRDHLAGCAGCAAEAAALQSLWDGLIVGDGETPSAALRARFDRMLERETAQQRGAQSAAAAETAPRSRELSRPLSRAGRRSFDRGWVGLALAASLAVALGAGVFIGQGTASKRSERDVAELRSEIQSLRSTVALALLAEPSPSERLNGVAYGRALQGEDRRVADALFTTLLDDPNVNVRLAALDALREESFRPETRKRLLESIPGQDSPLVQISAIDALLESTVAPDAAGAKTGDRPGTAPPRETAGAAATRDGLGRLAENPALDEVVRGYLRDRLERSPR